MKKNCLIFSIVIVLVAILVLGAYWIKGKNYKAKNPIATIQIEGYETPVKIELDPASAPNAVANFIKLANSGFYTDYEMTIGTNQISSNVTIDNMAKVSRINGQTDNDYVYGIKGDFIANGIKDNYIRNEKGVITMMRQDYSYFGYTEEGYNSANCNFAILTDDISNYNGYYAAFGKVVEGMDVIDQISSSRVDESTDENNTDENADNKTTTTSENKEGTTDENSEKEKEKENEESKVNTIKIKSITVDTFGADYGNPEIVNYEENYKKVQEIYNQYFNGSSSTVNE